MTTPDLVALVERLLKVESHNAGGVSGLCTNWYRNPDGPEAAAVIHAQAATIERLDADCSGIADQAYALEAERDKQDARIAELEGALRPMLENLHALDFYMKRPDHGGYGVECAVCMSEWFEPEDRAVMQAARSLLSEVTK